MSDSDRNREIRASRPDLRYIYPSDNRAIRQYEFDKVAKEGEEEPCWALHVAAGERNVEEMQRCLADPTVTGTSIDDTTMNQKSAKCKIGGVDDFDKCKICIPISKILDAYDIRVRESFSLERVTGILNLIRAMVRDPRFNPNVSVMYVPLITHLVRLDLCDIALELVGSSRFEVNRLYAEMTVLAELVHGDDRGRISSEDRSQGRLRVVRALLDHVGIDVNLSGKEPNASPLRQAILWSEIEMMKLLFADGRASVGVGELHSAIEEVVTSIASEPRNRSFPILSALIKYKRRRSVISSKRMITDNFGEVPISAIETALCHDPGEMGYTFRGGIRLRVMDLILESERVRVRGDRVRVEVATRNHARKTARAEGFPEDAEKEIAGWLSQAVIEPADVRRIINRPVYNPHSTIFFQRALFDFESKLNIQRICIDRERFCSKVSTRDFLI